MSVSRRVAIISIGGSVVECSPATRAARVRFPADAILFISQLQICYKDIYQFTNTCGMVVSCISELYSNSNNAIFRYGMRRKLKFGYLRHLMLKTTNYCSAELYGRLFTVPFGKDWTYLKWKTMAYLNTEFLRNIANNLEKLFWNRCFYNFFSCQSISDAILACLVQMPRSFSKTKLYREFPNMSCLHVQRMTGKRSKVGSFALSTLLYL